MGRLSELLNVDGGTNISALLGPTNTGKTWQAIERMLAHRTGMMGLPLRLLAREVYDRITPRVGEEAVALVTGEEKRIPRNPRFWVCTVESMPVERPVSFLAVDEIQLCAHKERGHVFTERLLHARGVHETMFMGAETIAPLLEQLVPTARIRQHARFSTLSYAGPRKLTALPSRSAVVAFSAADVYALAEQLRRRHGGTAVVLGALSPRTRNAQVAMYQAGEVQYMVATDAIGMGLNMDVDLVAFSTMVKFDGTEHRPLTAAEVAQIAGRAGRYRRDGRFAPLSSLGPLPEEIVEAVVQHRFPPLNALYWRNARLDFSGLEALGRSLQVAPPRRCLVRVRRAQDERALEALARMDEVRARSRSRSRVRLLWEVCQIPDYQKTLTHSHAHTLSRIFLELCRRDGQLDDDFLERRIGPLDRIDGDIETLMSRIASIRTWTYVAFRGDWVARSAHWQERTRRIEDRLSDALHDRLARRFVDRRAVVLLSADEGGERLTPEVDGDGRVFSSGQTLGRMEGLRFLPEEGLEWEADRALRKGVLRLLAPLAEERVHRLVESPSEAFSVTVDGTLRWEGAAVGRLVAGDHRMAPRVRVFRHELVGTGARLRVERRLLAWVRDQVTRLTSPFEAPEVERLSPPGRGIVYQVEQALGTLPRAQAADQLDALSRRDRRHLARLDLRRGYHYLYVASLLEPRHLLWRALLSGLWAGCLPLPVPQRETQARLPLREGIPARVYQDMGFPLVGGVAVRVDLLETVDARLRGLARRGAFSEPREILEEVTVEPDQARALLRGLGYVQAPGKPPRWRPSRPPPRRR